MRIAVQASALDMTFMSLANEATQPPKTDFATKQQKLTADGKPLFTARSLKALSVDDQGTPTGSDDSVSLAITQPRQIHLGKLYRLTGNVTITHYVQSNNRLGVSIIADSVEPVGNTSDKQ